MECQYEHLTHCHLCARSESGRSESGMVDGTERDASERSSEAILATGNGHGKDTDGRTTTKTDLRGRGRSVGRKRRELREGERRGEERRGGAFLLPLLRPL